MQDISEAPFKPCGSGAAQRSKRFVVPTKIQSYYNLPCCCQTSSRWFCVISALHPVVNCDPDSQGGPQILGDPMR